MRCLNKELTLSQQETKTTKIMVLKEQIKDLRERLDALRRFL